METTKKSVLRGGDTKTTFAKGEREGGEGR